MLMVLVAAVLATSSALADSRKWTRGIPTVQQERANELFGEANELFARQAYSLARERYVQAVALWKHPQIQFNLAVTLSRLDRVIEALEAVDDAMRFGAEPFTRDLYEQVEDLKRHLMERVGTLEVSCTQKNGTVTLDGQLWIACPGKAHRYVLADSEHAVVAEAPKSLTNARTVSVPAGKTLRERIVLAPLHVSRRYRVEVTHPVPRWMPWIAIGLGTAIGGSAVITYQLGRRDQQRFDDQFAALCADGCDARFADHPELVILENRAAQRREMALGLSIVGGTVVVGGIVWAALLNRPRARAVPVEVAPARGGAVVSSSFNF
jgi:hypothetical protein